MLSGGEQATVFNFTRPPMMSKDHRVMVEGVYAAIARNLQPYLSSRIRESVDVRVAALDVAVFADVVSSLVTPCVTYVFRAGGTPAISGMLDIGADLTVHCIDRICGGPGGGGTLARPLTRIEEHLLKDFAEKILLQLSLAWPSQGLAGLEGIGFEATPENIQIVTPRENVQICRLEVKTASIQSGLTFILPLSFVEKTIDERLRELRLGRPAGVADSASQALVQRTLSQAALTVTARTPAIRLRTRDVAKLAPGQVILLTREADDPIEVLVNGRHRFMASMGQSRRRLAARILNDITATAGAHAALAPFGRVDTMADGQNTTPTNGKTPAAAGMESLMELSLPVTIEFGRTSMTLQQVLELAPGSVIGLDRAVGDPVDIYVSDRKLAGGEVVIVGENFGVRILRLTADPSEVGAA
jgi:flagellar motor switch protein FliN/FliY